MIEVLPTVSNSSLAPEFGAHVGLATNVIEAISDVVWAGFALIMLARTQRRFPEYLMIPELVE